MSSSSKGSVLALLAFIAAGASWIASRFPTSLGSFAGGTFMAIGVVNVLFHRRFARRDYAKAQSMSSTVVRVWDSIGEKGIQALYLGIGIICAVVGCVLLIRSSQTH